MPNPMPQLRKAEVTQRTAEVTVPRKCPKGHAMTKKNTYVRPGGTRVECRECMADMRAAYRDRQQQRKAQTQQPARYSKAKQEATKSSRPLSGPSSPRGLITQALRNLGGEVHDEQGRASSVLYKEARRIGYTGSAGGMNHLLLTMQREGLVRRDKGGPQSRKCYLIQLRDYEPDIEPAEEQPVPQVTQPQAAPVTSAVKAPRAEDLFKSRVNVPNTAPAAEPESTTEEFEPEEQEEIDLISPAERAKIDALLNDFDEDTAQQLAEPIDFEGNEEDEALALLLQNIDPHAVVRALVEHLRQGGSAEEVGALRNKVFALEAELGGVTNELRAAQAQCRQLQTECENIKAASDELLTEAARGQAATQAELAKLQAENAELRSHRPLAAGMPVRDKVALKKALQQIQHR